MSTPHPHSVSDLALAPMLIEIERNLAWLRDCENLGFELALQLNDIESAYKTPADRAARIARCATRDVDLHGWRIHPTSDLYGLTVEHGTYQVSVMFGKRLTRYIELPAGSQVPVRGN